MHPDSMLLMTRFRDEYRPRIEFKSVLDVGSQDINGSYREIFEGVGCKYTGVDIVEWKNVDVLAPFDRLPFEDNSFDVVVSGQMLEHAEKPWIIVKEMARVLRPGDIVCWIAPWRFHVHRDGLCPYDRWRILDDGMKVLLAEAGLVVLDCQMHADDTYGIGEKLKED